MVRCSPVGAVTLELGAQRLPFRRAVQAVGEDENAPEVVQADEVDEEGLALSLVAAAEAEHLTAALHVGGADVIAERLQHPAGTVAGLPEAAELDVARARHAGGGRQRFPTQGHRHAAGPAIRFGPDGRRVIVIERGDVFLALAKARRMLTENDA